MKFLGRIVLTVLALYGWNLFFNKFMAGAVAEPIATLKFLVAWIYILGIFAIGTVFGVSVRR